MTGGRKLEEFTFPSVAEYLRKYMSASPTFSKNEKWRDRETPPELEKKIREGAPIMGFNGKNINKWIKKDDSNENNSSSDEIVDSDEVDDL